MHPSLLLAALMLGLFSLTAAQTTSANKSGSFGDPGTWFPSAPVFNSSVIVPGPFVVTMVISSPSLFALSVNAGASLVFNNSATVDFTAGGGLYVQGGTIDATLSIATGPIIGSTSPRVIVNGASSLIIGTPGAGGNPFPGAGTLGRLVLITDATVRDVDILHPIDIKGATRNLFVQGKVLVGSFTSILNHNGATQTLKFDGGTANATIGLSSSTNLFPAFFVTKGYLMIYGSAAGQSTLNVGGLSSDSTATSAIVLENDVAVVTGKVDNSVTGLGKLRTSNDTNKIAWNSATVTCNSGTNVAVELTNTKADLWDFIGLRSRIFGRVYLDDNSNLAVTLSDSRGDKSFPTFIQNFYTSSRVTSGEVTLTGNMRIATSATDFSTEFLGSGTVMLVEDPKTQFPWRPSGQTGITNWPSTIVAEFVQAEIIPGISMNVSLNGFISGLLTVLSPGQGDSYLIMSPVSHAGALAFHDKDAFGTPSPPLSGRFFVVFSGQISLTNPCNFTALGAAYNLPNGYLVFSPDSGIIPLNRCAWGGPNMSLSLELRSNDPSVGVSFILPSSLQVGRFSVGGNASAFTTGRISVLSPLLRDLATNASGPFFDMQSGFDPSAQIGAGARLVAFHSISVMKDLILRGTGTVGSTLRVVGANVVVSASWIGSDNPNSTVILEWNASSCVDPSQNQFPRIEANGMWCLRTVCQQYPFLSFGLNFVIDTSGTPFAGNTTFAIVDDPVDSAAPLSVKFVNTGGMSYSFDKRSTTRIINDVVTKFAEFYFFPSGALPPWFPCSRTDCQRVQISPTEFVNSCDNAAAVNVTSGFTFNGTFAAGNLTVTRAKIIFSRGSNVSVSLLDMDSESIVELQGSVRAAVGGANISGNVTFDDFAGVTASRPVRLSPTAVLRITNRLSGAALSGPVFIIGGRLVIRLTQPLFGANVTTTRTRDTVQTVQTVPVAQFSSSSSGNFSSVSIDPSSPALSSCDVNTVSTATQSSSTLSVTVTTTRDTSQPGCALPSSGLSTGAIVGIAVGSAVVALLIVTVLVIWCRKREVTKRNAIFMSNMNKRESSRHDPVPN